MCFVFDAIVDARIKMNNNNNNNSVKNEQLGSGDEVCGRANTNSKQPNNAR